MKAVDPTIQLLSSYPTVGVLEKAGKWVDWVCPHHYSIANLAGAEADRWTARIFTPGMELPFAGHPTIGTAIALAELGRVAGDSVTLDGSINTAINATALSTPAGGNVTINNGNYAVGSGTTVSLEGTIDTGGGNLTIYSASISNAGVFLFLFLVGIDILWFFFVAEIGVRLADPDAQHAHESRQLGQFARQSVDVLGTPVVLGFRDGLDPPGVGRPRLGPLRLQELDLALQLPHAVL